MGTCCSSQEDYIVSEFPSEKFIRKEINNLHITKLHYKDIKKILQEKMAKILKSNKIDKNLFKQVLEEFFLGNDKNIIKTNLQSKMFECFFGELNHNTSVEEILFLAFPLFIKNRSEEVHDFVESLSFSRQGKIFTYETLKSSFLKIFEFYTFKISKTVEIHLKISPDKMDIINVNQKYFNFPKIEKAVEDKLHEINSNAEINSVDLMNYLKNKNIFNFKDIRDFVLMSK